MDDGRILLPAFKKGWRWKDGGLQFTRRWSLEDENKSGLERTREIIEASLQEIHQFLRFTTEVGEGEDEWLPTLDTMMRVEENNTISFKYYEKPTTTNTMVQKRSALNENSKNQILANDLIRRMGNTDERQGKYIMGMVVDQFAKKVLTSGYTIQQTKRIVINGIRGWEKRKSLAMKERNKLFRSGKESRPQRIKKKTVGRTTWFKKKPNSKKDTTKLVEDAKIRGGCKDKKSTGKRMNKKDENNVDMRTIAVLFVENTKEGVLARELREVMERIKYILGYNIKIVERSGTPLKLMFALSRIGEGGECGREDCDLHPGYKRRTITIMQEA